MVNRTCSSPKIVPVVLVAFGWLCFLASLVTENPLFKTLLLVAARALPFVLGLGGALSPTM